MKTFLIVAFLLIIGYADAQSLIGVWQESTPQVSAGSLNAYEFNKDGTFRFRLDEYFTMKRTISFTGTYKVVKNELTLTILATSEVVGGNIERSDIGGEKSGGWEIDGGEVKTITLPKPKKAVIVLEMKKSDKGADEMILLDKRKYYKIE